MGSKQRHILVSGAGGLIGSAFVAAHRALGDDVIPLLRPGKGGDGVHWRADGTLSPDAVSGFDAVVHLAGEPVLGRWTARKKRRIRDSRVDGTHKLATALAAAKRPPQVFLCASGINFYGDAGDVVLDESAPMGSGFLAEVSQAWEAAAAPLAAAARVVTARIGVVLSPRGGTLAAVLPLFRLGLAGPIGGGAQFLSWISLDDLIAAFDHMLASPNLRGPVNVVSPAPVTNREFTAALARAVHRPAAIPVPAWAIRLLLGETAEETVLASIRAVPRRLLDDGFVFHQPTLPDALAALHLTRQGPTR